MPRGFLFVLCSAVALGQVPRREPFEIALQSYWDARASGDFDTASARREDAGRLLTQTPADSPQFLSKVQSVAQIYQNSGRWAQVRAVVHDALSRTDMLSESHPVRIQLLNMLADFWQQDGNLLRALSYREKAVAAQELAPPRDSPEPLGFPASASSPSITANGVAGRMTFLSTKGQLASGRGPNNIYVYQQLADLYRQLGRPAAATKAMGKMRSLIQNDPRQLAAFNERQGDLDEAAANYRKASAQAAANADAQVWEVIGPLQSIANLYQREQRFEQAAATLRDAVGVLEASGKPEAHNQAVGLRLDLANLLQQGAQSRDADQVYETLVSENASDRNDLGRQLQVLQAYANHLSVTNRASQGENLLKAYLANHADLQPREQANVLFSLSQIARRAGRNELAGEYQRAGMEKQLAAQPQQSGEGLLIGPDLQKAQAAANQGDLDKAEDLVLHILARAPFARDREQVAWQVPSIAAVLTSRKAPEKGEQLYHQLLTLLQTWSVDNTTPLTQTLQQYARFLIGQKDRWGEATGAIERFRENLIAARGAETGELKQVIQLRIDFAQARGAQAEVARSAEELLAFEASLSGTTSEPYMRAAQTAANVYQSAGNQERALALHQQIITIADTTLPANAVDRGYVRINAAFALASARRFEEAERLANEAVSIGEGMRPPQTNQFALQAEQIRRMNRTVESGSVGPDDVGFGAVVKSSSQWFEIRATQMPNIRRPTSIVAVPGIQSVQPPAENKAAEKGGQQ